MYALDFEYANERLSDYGMIVCQFDSPGSVETVSSGADIVFNQIKPSGSYHFNIASSTYDTAYTTTFQICKSPYQNDPNEMTLSTVEISSLQRWLCRKNQYHKFKIDQEGFEHIFWNAAFSVKQINLNSQTIGMELTLFTDAPFAYMDELRIMEDCSTNLSFNVHDMSDEEGYIYPDLKIELLESGDFILKNNLQDKKTTKIKNCAANEIITIYGKHHIIKSSTSHVLYYDFNYVFPRIINNYSNNINTFTCNLPCKIEITYSPIRKVGI